MASDVTQERQQAHAPRELSFQGIVSVGRHQTCRWIPASPTVMVVGHTKHTATTIMAIATNNQVSSRPTLNTVSATQLCRRQTGGVCRDPSKRQAGYLSRVRESGELP